MTNSVYITTTIPYVNARPHVGFALELVQADVIARHRARSGSIVRLQTGADENSLKNVLAAEKAGKPVEEFVATNAEAFKSLQEALGICSDGFIRTSHDKSHRIAVEAVWNACHRNGDLYKKAYSGLYCVGCEQFYEQEDLVAGCCPEHGTEPEHVTETNWFFRLSRYRDQLVELIESGQLSISPETRANEVRALLSRGLHDFSVSRSSTRARGWGIPVPGDPEQTIYVWFDALVNYISALGYSGDDELYRRFWESADVREHLVGKGVTRFHAVYWPAILLSADLPTPTSLKVHGYLTVDGKKIGKSNGNAIDPEPIADKYGADALRYYLLRHVRPTEDGDFSIARLEEVYDAELVGQLGNLVNRITSISYRNDVHVDPIIPDADLGRIFELRGAVREALDRFAFNEALRHLFDFVAELNRRVAQDAPWTLAARYRAGGDQESFQKLKCVLDAQFGLLKAVAIELEPLLSTTAAAIIQRLNEARYGSKIAPTLVFERLTDIKNR